MSFVFLFLLKCRYPRGTAVTEIVYTRYGREALHPYRRLEKFHFKQEKIRLDISIPIKEMGNEI